MDWSYFENGLFKNYSNNCFDNNLDNKREDRDFLEENNNLMNDFEIKHDEFILDKSLRKNSNNTKNKGDFKLNLENYYEVFSESKISEAGTQICEFSNKQFQKDNGFSQLKNEDLKSDKLSNKQTEYSSSPFIGNQTSTNNNSHLDDSKSHSSESASDSIKKRNLNCNNKMAEENENNKFNFENISMKNNNYTEYNEEENNQINHKNKNNNKLCLKDLHLFPSQQIIQDEFYASNRLTVNNLMVTNQKYILLNQDNISISEKMKAKIQKTKDLLEKRQYKVIENTNMNEYFIADGKKFQYNLESAYQFSELKNNNISKKNNCPDCINVMNRINYINKNQNNSNENNKKNTAKAQKNLMIDGASKKNVENTNLKLYSTSDIICFNTESVNGFKNNSTALVEKYEFNNKENSNYYNVVESLSSNGTSKNSCMDISLNEEIFTGGGIRNNLNKKELKMLRNRISAQKSRDRKKKEMDDLKLITQELFNQNVLLKKQLEEKDNQISDIKEMFNLLCNNCKGILAFNKNQNQNDNSNFFYEDGNNKKYLYSNDLQKHINTKNCLNFDKSINTLKNNLISNKRNRVNDFQSIVNNGNRRIVNNLKYGIMTGFLVMACILGSFAFNFGFNFSEQQTEISNQDISYKSRILQENTIDNDIHIRNSSLNVKNESYMNDSNQTIKIKNKNPLILDLYENAKSLVIYKQKDSSKNLNFEKLKELSLNKNDQYLKNIRDKINLHYYLNLSKQIIDKVDKNIYDLTYLTDLSQDSKNIIAQNLIKNINKIKNFFELNISGEYAYDNYEDVKSRDFAFLGKKRVNFIKRNNLEINKKEKNEFLNFEEWPNNEECLEPIGVRYTISDYDFEDDNEILPNPLLENYLDDIKLNDYFEKNKFKGNSQKFNNISSLDLNKKNLNQYEIHEAINKNLIVKSNDSFNKNTNNKGIDIPYIIDNDNEKVKSFFCNDFISFTDEQTEFFRRVFTKLDVLKQDDTNKEKKNLGKNIFKNNEESKEEEIEVEKKNDEDCLYLHMIIPEQNFRKDQVTSDSQDYRNSNSSTFNNKNNNERESNNNKKVFYEVGCKIFEINKIYK